MDMTVFDPVRRLWGIAEDCGYPESAVTPWVERFGQVPNALRLWYTTVGACPGLNDTQDWLVPPEKINDVLCDDYLVFYRENQGGYGWGVRAEDCAQDDPVVWENVDGHFQQDGWVMTTNTVSRFLIAQSYVQAVCGGLGFYDEDGGITGVDADAVARIAKRFPSKGVDADLVVHADGYGKYQFFGGPDVVIAIDGRADTGFEVMCASQEEREFMQTVAALKEIIGGFGDRAEGIIDALNTAVAP